MKRLLLVAVSVYLGYTATIGKKIPVPDSNGILQDLIYRVAVPNANQQIHDSVWWIPVENKYGASKVSVPNGGKTYTTYSFTYTLGRSLCSSTQVPISGLKNCKIDTSSNKKMTCAAYLAWNENDWSSVEIENRCAKM